MTRLEKFHSLASHAWLKRSYARLTAQERAIAMQFLSTHAETPAIDFERAVNRLFLDREKPKRWTELVELLTCCTHS